MLDIILSLRTTKRFIGKVLIINYYKFHGTWYYIYGFYSFLGTEYIELLEEINFKEFFYLYLKLYQKKLRQAG
jgi:hypothetical protein